MNRKPFKTNSAAQHESNGSVFPFEAEETLQDLNHIEAMATFADLKRHEFTLSFRNIRNLETLKVLLEVRPDLKERNFAGLNYLRLAVENGAVDWIEYLVKAGYSFHEKDLNGQIPMFYVKFDDINCVDVIYALIEPGTDIYAMNNGRENIAHCLLSVNSSFEVVTKFVDYTLERGYIKLWTMKNRYGTSAYQLLSRKLGETHSSVKSVLSKLKLTSSQCEH